MTSIVNEKHVLPRIDRNSIRGACHVINNLLATLMLHEVGWRGGVGCWSCGVGGVLAKHRIWGVEKTRGRVRGFGRESWCGWVFFRINEVGAGAQLRLVCWLGK